MSAGIKITVVYSINPQQVCRFTILKNVQLRWQQCGWGELRVKGILRIADEICTQLIFYILGKGATKEVTTSKLVPSFIDIFFKCERGSAPSALLSPHLDRHFGHSLMVKDPNWDPFKSFVRQAAVERLEHHQIRGRFVFAGQPRGNKSL